MYVVSAQLILGIMTVVNTTGAQPILLLPCTHPPAVFSVNAERSQLIPFLKTCSCQERGNSKGRLQHTMLSDAGSQ